MDILDKLTQLVLNTRNHLEPSEINCGDCWLWATIANTKLPGSELCTATNRYNFGHAFLFYNDKYYDSESPKGVDNWRELSYFKNDDDLNANSEVKTFYKFRWVSDWTYFIEDNWSQEPNKDLDDITRIDESLAL